ncbi:hypothetical protein L3Q82_017801 [Scortum barcoo]|uniref:Uncharacterized protein n=1 Tax=Scortum barcoo TaxID=214431 RepID=A0ACB8VLW9_9TELE|nr:hypothetical protein L3Q82_017801 [Scortum barcoo]
MANVGRCPDLLVFWFPNWTPSGPWLRLEIPLTKGSPAGVQNELGTGLTYCQKCEPSSCSGHTETEQPLAKGPGPHTSGTLSHRIPRGTWLVNAFSRSTKHLWTGWANSHKPSRRTTNQPVCHSRGTLSPTSMQCCNAAECVSAKTAPQHPENMVHSDSMSPVSLGIWENTAQIQIGEGVPPIDPSRYHCRCPRER